MKHASELDPELRGLLEEIAADPRSRLRLAPRHALRSWYLTDEIARPRNLDATAAERHLVAAHREALAALYCEASVLAYWQAPSQASRRQEFASRETIGARLEGVADRMSQRALGDRGHLASVDRLRKGDRCRGLELAESALALQPTSAARLSLGFHLRVKQPRTALELFRRVGAVSSGAVRERACSAAGATAVSLGDLPLALACYRESASSDHRNLPWVLNLALCLGHGAEARACLDRLAEWRPSEFLLAETTRVLRDWLSPASPQTKRARAEARRIGGSKSEFVERILNEYL